MTMAMRDTRLKSRRGFAMIVAIVLIGLVGIALAGLMLALSADAKRTEKEAVDSQLRQLIVAGEMQVHGQAVGVAPIVMAPPIGGENAQVVIRSTDEDKSGGVTVEARLGPRSVKEQIVDRTK